MTLSKFPSLCPEGIKITSMLWINVHQDPLLLVGSADGVIRIWKTMDKKCKLINPEYKSGFTGLPLLSNQKSYNGIGLICKYDKNNSNLYVSGSQNNIRVWNLEKEKCVSIIEGNNNGINENNNNNMDNNNNKWLVSCLDACNNLVISGDDVGCVRVYDIRCSNNEYILRSEIKDSNNWIVRVNICEDKKEIVSVSMTGEINYYDLNTRKCTSTIKAYDDEILTACDIHPIYPLIATGSKSGQLNMFNMDSKELLCSYTSHSGMFSRSFSAINSLSFHGGLCNLAVSSVDSIVSHFSPSESL